MNASSGLTLAFARAFPLQREADEEAILEETSILIEHPNVRDVLEFSIFKKGSKAWRRFQIPVLTTAWQSLTPK
jgi:hypothetical protein